MQEIITGRVNKTMALELVHSVSIYDNDTKRDLFIVRERMPLEKRYDNGDIANLLHNADLDYDLMFEAAKIARDKGAETMQEFVKDYDAFAKKYGWKGVWEV